MRAFNYAVIIITNMLGDSISSFLKTIWLSLGFFFELVDYPKALLVNNSDQ